MHIYLSPSFASFSASAAMNFAWVISSFFTEYLHAIHIEIIAKRNNSEMIIFLLCDFLCLCHNSSNLIPNIVAMTSTNACCLPSFLLTSMPRISSSRFKVSNAGGKHSSFGFWACGVPPTMKGIILSPLPCSKNDSTSSFTHTDFADSGEQTTMRYFEDSNSFDKASLSFVPLRSCLYQNTGLIFLGKSGYSLQRALGT